MAGNDEPPEIKADKATVQGWLDTLPRGHAPPHVAAAAARCEAYHSRTQQQPPAGRGWWREQSAPKPSEPRAADRYAALARRPDVPAVMPAWRDPRTA